MARYDLLGALAVQISGSTYEAAGSGVAETIGDQDGPSVGGFTLKYDSQDQSIETSDPNNES